MILSENEPIWYVCHTKPRCEKRFAQLMELEGFAHYLPLALSVRRYGTHTKKFTKPLFPSYVFAQMPATEKFRAHQQDHLVRMLQVVNESTFLRQVESIKTLIASGLQLGLCPPMEKGARVKVTAGPLWGLEGIVDDPKNPKGIVISVDILQQGVHVLLPPEALKLVEI
jgi:transcriptional antiterminator RfaH